MIVLLGRVSNFYPEDATCVNSSGIEFNVNTLIRNHISVLRGDYEKMLGWSHETVAWSITYQIARYHILLTTRDWECVLRRKE